MDINVDWPLWPRQREALESIANDQLFGGASEGGKSYLGRVGLCCAGMECEGLTMTLIRKKFDDILTNHLEGDKGFRKLLYPLSSKGIVDISQKGIRFPKGNVLHFKHCQDERQFDSAQGNENQVVVVDEAPQIKERLIRAFRGWCRITPEHLARQPPFWQKKLPWFLQTGNPTGASVGYYRRQYVKARAPFAIEDIGGFRRQYVPSRAEDNLSVNLALHQARLAEIGDPELAKALDTGDWDALVGDFLRQYDEDRHVTPDFIPPEHWFKFMSFDWGSSEPFVVHWWAISDGQMFRDDQGRKRWYPLGALICYREWYGCSLIDQAKGLEMRNEDIAQGIVDRTPHRENNSGLIITDSLPFQDRGMSKDSKKWKIADVFNEIFLQKNANLKLVLGNTARQQGWSRLRDRLIGFENWPMIYICSRCNYLREYIPALQRHETNPNDAVESGEATHCCDSARLAAMLKPFIRTAPKEESVPDMSKADKITPKAILNQLQKKRRSLLGRR